MLFKLVLGQNLFLIGFYIFLTLSVATEVGYRLGHRINRKKDTNLSEKQEKGVGIITSAMLALIAFVMAISISMAVSRFDTRRKLVLEEANAINTAYLRAQRIGGVRGEAIMRLLGDYTQLHIDFLAARENQERLKTIYEKMAVIQQRIWSNASDIAALPPTPTTALLLGSLNQVFDLTTALRWSFEVRVPLNVFKFLHVVSLLAVGVMGYYFSLSQRRHFVLCLLLLFAFTASMLLIIDLDKPRAGDIRIEQSPLIWTLDSIKENAN
ncbi:MAG: hypothetical protein JXA42_01110 [Anaerolineales bacterium]|nr:hypothetical protein [Anaerolineales bacterium]